MFKEIEFIPSSEECQFKVKTPSPAKNYIPDWYKDIKAVTESNITADLEQNIKMCMPFLDSMTTGYIQETWCDILIDIKNGELVYRYSDSPEIISIRDKVSIPIDNTYYPYEFIWKGAWMPKLPKGYSALITHPFNNVNLPFTTLSGIIDSDIFHHTRFGNFPFYIKNNFTGIIPAGTPMYQIIPIKRDKWISKSKNYDHPSAESKEHLMRHKFLGVYKNIFWQKKLYK